MDPFRERREVRGGGGGRRRARRTARGRGRRRRGRRPRRPTPIAAVKPPKRRKRKPSPDTPRTAFDIRPPAPRQSLLDAWQRIPHRVKWLGYHATAALAGWRLGWVDWGTDTAAWYANGHWLSPSAFALYGLGTVVVALYRRSRGWVWLAAWTAAIPVSSVVAGVLLYGTGYHP
ncbi:hypothetical protein O3Q52_17620 [Streptomyces sp. ActVer]|uniref:hypothetical protein n=1 Tax=Streptomyces sp. ActVer TaxID=3014558 RepID=UPI0022B5B93F|nr:hypothetical protein [Streptomyces sp. ActVer]MCZ4509985.1 hypothetical protein [Streptomyces sp. ActVer]